MIAITGNTYPVRAQLAALGGKWDKVGKCWMVPEDKAEEAKRIVNTPARDLARDKGLAYYVKLKDEWCVCVPNTGGLSVFEAEQKHVGKMVQVTTKAGKVKGETLGLSKGKTIVGDWAFAVVRRGPPMVQAAQGPRDPGEDSADRWNEGGGVS